MKKFKKAALTAASYVSVAALAIGGTLAFNYDDESKINTLEVGDAVDIVINEYQRNDNKDALEDFEQGKELYPIVGSAQGEKDTFGMPVAQNYGDKIVTIDNIGQADAFIRVFVAKPLALSDLAKDGDKNTSDDALHMNFGNRVNLEGKYDAAYGDKWKENWGWQYNVDVFEAEIDGEKYEVSTFITSNPLKKGIESTAVIAGVYLDSSVDYDNGVYTMGDYTLDYDFSNGVNVPVYAEAVAASDGMTWEDAFKDRDAKEIFATWAKNIKAPVIEDADSKDALLEALNTESNDVIIDMDGAKLDLNGAFTKANVPADTTVTIKNATITGRSYGNDTDGTIVFNDCTFANEEGAYSIHFDGGKGNVIFNNCNLKGWSSFGSLSSVEMNNCTISGNGSYSMVRFYQNAVLNNCKIDAADVNKTDEYFDGISAVNGAVVTLNDCTVTNAGYQVETGSEIIVMEKGSKVDVTIEEVPVE